MDDFIKIEVDRIFSGPVPAIEDAQIVLWQDMLTMSDAGRDQESVEII